MREGCYGWRSAGGVALANHFQLNLSLRCERQHATNGLQSGEDEGEGEGDGPDEEDGLPGVALPQRRAARSGVHQQVLVGIQSGGRLCRRPRHHQLVHVAGQ